MGGKKIIILIALLPPVVVLRFMTILIHIMVEYVMIMVFATPSACVDILQPVTGIGLLGWELIMIMMPVAMGLTLSILLVILAVPVHITLPVLQLIQVYVIQQRTAIGLPLANILVVRVIQLIAWLVLPRPAVRPQAVIGQMDIAKTHNRHPAVQAIASFVRQMNVH